MVSSYAMTACVSYTIAAQRHFRNEVKVNVFLTLACVNAINSIVSHENKCKCGVDVKR